MDLKHGDQASGELVASLFTDELDEWRAAVPNVGRDENFAPVKGTRKTTRLPR